MPNYNCSRAVGLNAGKAETISGRSVGDNFPGKVHRFGSVMHRGRSLGIMRRGWNVGASIHWSGLTTAQNPCDRLHCELSLLFRDAPCMSASDAMIMACVGSLSLSANSPMSHAPEWRQGIFGSLSCTVMISPNRGLTSWESGLRVVSGNLHPSDLDVVRQRPADAVVPYL